MVETSSLVRLHTSIPDLCCLHLGRFALLELFLGHRIQLVDFYRVHRENSIMNGDSLQVGKTRYTHYSIAYHLVWIPKYRRRILTGEVQKETKRLIEECCQRQGLTLLALETDEDHIHVFVSAPPRFSPALIANLRKADTPRATCVRSSHNSKRCVERNTFGPVRITWARQATFRQKSSNATLKSVRENRYDWLGCPASQPACKQRRFHPVP